jgi:hypothetical protein
MHLRLLSLRFLLLLGAWIFGPALGRADDVPHKLAVGVTYLGGQLHWGFAPKWALELRLLHGDEVSSTAGTVSATAFGLRGYRYFSAPRRARIFVGLEGAATRSYANTYDYETTG